VSSDVRLKNQFFGETAGFWPLHRRLLVNVRILTFRGDVPAPGYRVSFNPLSDAQKKTPIFPFGSDTNDARRLLPPGNYFMRLTRDGQTTLGETVAVGMNGGEQEDIRIDVSRLDNARVR
jgi:hypothetical protein